MTLKTWNLSNESDSFVFEASLDCSMIILLYNYILFQTGSLINYMYKFVKKQFVVYKSNFFPDLTN